MRYQEYVTFERDADTKHEFANGHAFGMSGGTRAHNLIAVNIVSTLHAALRGRPCLVFNSDMRVKTGDGTGAYPDGSALCGGPVFSDEREDELLNPSLIIEVLSESTEAYDRGEKFVHYSATPSVKEYVLAPSRRAALEVFTREGDGSWSLRRYGAGDVVRLTSLDCQLAVDDAYLKVLGPDLD